jgi:hypothetical protein
VKCFSPSRQHAHPVLARRAGKEKDKCIMTIGYDKPLYVLPFDHRATFSNNVFGCQGSLSPEQNER